MMRKCPYALVKKDMRAASVAIDATYGNAARSLASIVLGTMIRRTGS
jgi:regulator of extracellular matrix RemA (YlzA/DUF370 family)